MDPNTKIEIGPGRVEYRTVTSSGVRVIRVHLTTLTPRISAYSETFSGGYSVQPLTLFLDEVHEYIRDALERTGNGELYRSILNELKET